MRDAAHRVTTLDPSHDLAGVDCGIATYNDWLALHAADAVAARVAAVYVLTATTDSGHRVVRDLRDQPDPVPRSMSRGWPATVPAWKLGMLAIHRDLRGTRGGSWRRDLLRATLATILRVADAGGGKVIVVDADNEGLVGFCLRNGFKSTGGAGPLSLDMKVSTARKAL